VESKRGENLVSTVPEKKIPLPIGFTDLAAGDFDAIVQQDVAALSPLFEHVVVTKPGQISAAPVLFLYAHFNDDGYIRDLGPRGVRQIIEATQASIVVVASPISPQILQTAASLPGPKSANIIFTLDRNQSFFGTFFKDLFERMRNGQEMLRAWVEIAPQGPVQRNDIPATILLAEAGKLAFPASKA
jgi:hypothetical protein